MTFDYRYEDRKPNITQIPIHGEHLTFWYLGKYCRYYLVIPNVPWETLSMQDSACCDNNRTSLVFKVPDNLIFVGGTTGFRTAKKSVFRASIPIVSSQSTAYASM